MNYVISILVGVIFAVIAAKRGFYIFWAVLFDIMISIYLAVMLAPVIEETVIEQGLSRYYLAGCVFLIAALTFTILFGIMYLGLIKSFSVSFPNFFNVCGAGFLGFITGYLLCSFVLFIVCISPAMEMSFVKKYLDRQRMLDAVRVPVIKVCDFIGSVSLQCGEGVAEKVVTDISTVDEDEQRMLPEKPSRNPTPRETELGGADISSLTSG